MPKRPDQRSREAMAWRDWYKSKEWHRLRTKHLAVEPHCIVCLRQKRFDPTFVMLGGSPTVDHIKPHKGSWSLFTDPNNLQTLCPTHHSSTKARIERGREVAAIGADGWPVEDRT